MRFAQCHTYGTACEYHHGMNRTESRRCAIAGCNNKLKTGAFMYCSVKCQHVRQKRRPKYTPGDSYKKRAATFFMRGGLFGYVAPNFLARILRDYYGERCLRCGWSQRNPKTGKIPIEVEHIDGNWENSRLTNLTLLCPNCHALTPTFRGLNRGRGRAYRLSGVEVFSRNGARMPESKRFEQEVFEPKSRQLELPLPT
jgi:hypothetical protein